MNYYRFLMEQLQILLVEDNRFFQKIISDFAAIHGFSLKIAENGKIAIDMLLRNNFDLILMDIEMPEMDGYETTGLSVIIFPKPDKFLLLSLPATNISNMLLKVYLLVLTATSKNLFWKQNC